MLKLSASNYNRPHGRAYSPPRLLIPLKILALPPA